MPAGMDAMGEELAQRALTPLAGRRLQKRYWFAISAAARYLSD